MKQLTLALMALFSLSTQAAQLSTFADIADAVNQGKQLSFVTQFNHCESDIPLGDVTASVKPNAVLLFAGKRVTASDKHFTLNDPQMPGVPIFGYAKFDINADGSATVNITRMKAEDYSKINAYGIRCQLGDGLKVFA